MDRRRLALVLLLAFVACTGISIVLDGIPPTRGPDVVPWLLQGLGYVFGIAGGVLLLAPRDDEATAGRDRRIGAVVMPALLALVLIDAVDLATAPGAAEISAGFVRLLLLIVIGVATDRLARDVAAERRRR